MIHYVNLIKAEKMKYYNDYETLLFARAKSEIKSVTGVLPLTFTAKAGNATDWVIYGNDENGTENEFDGIYPGISDITKYMSLNIGNGQFTLWSTTPLVSGLGSSLFLLAGQATTGASTATNGVYDGQSRTVTAIGGYITIGYRMSGVDPRNYQTMLVKGSTAPDHYIPYQKGVGEQRVDGYYVPLTISQQGQPDKTYDIYIGDTPLTEGETVSKTSTGVDIELFEGENTVSTTLYNKPAMEIKYKSRR